MTNAELIALWNTLFPMQVSTEKASPKLLYSLRLIQNKAKPFIDALSDAQKTPADCLDYVREHEQLLIQHAAKDDRGNPIVVHNQYQIADETAFRKAADALVAAHPGVVEKLKQHQIAVRDLLAAESEYTPPVQVSLDALPGEMTGRDFAALFPIIQPPPTT